ncbi:MAG TPA: NifB/NifX family molybdenum-iron cluster-binding protein [Candidatus Absconditabacterales bacterium]|nr:NifB/NifX family molybdenum-iron cluster-binding protein [Candidatus Absconditabacterales bacterium]
MIIVKPVLEKKENAEIAINSARASYFVFFEDDKFVKFVKNPFTVGGGAGFAVADLLKNEGCEKFLAKKIGDNMKAKLEENGIIYEIVK